MRINIVNCLNLFGVSSVSRTSVEKNWRFQFRHGAMFFIRFFFQLLGKNLYSILTIVTDFRRKKWDSGGADL